MPNSAWHLRKYSSGARYGVGQADSEEGTRKRNIQNTKIRTGKTLQFSMFRCTADHPETHLALCLQPPVEGPRYCFMSVVWPFTCLVGEPSNRVSTCGNILIMWQRLCARSATFKGPMQHRLQCMVASEFFSTCLSNFTVLHCKALETVIQQCKTLLRP